MVERRSPEDRNETNLCFSPISPKFMVTFKIK
jgi:hypothetical protein